MLTKAQRDDRRNAALHTQVELVHGGLVDPPALHRAVRESVLLLLGQPDAGVAATTDGRGVRWVHAFTAESELARFATARDAAAPPVAFLAIRGDRLLDGLLDRVGDVSGDLGAAPEPVDATVSGLTIDLAGDRPLLLPPGWGAWGSTTAFLGAAR